MSLYEGSQCPECQESILIQRKSITGDFVLACNNDDCFFFVRLKTPNKT